MQTRGSDGGQATVELTLVLPLLALILLAIVQVAVVARDHVAVVHATRAAARAAVEQPDPAHVRTAAHAAASLDPALLEVTLSGGSAVGDRFAVTVRYRAVTDVLLVGRLFPDLTMSETLVGRVG